MKLAVSTMIAVVLLSLAICVFFSLRGLPLNPPSIAVVVGFSILVVLLGRWLWTRLHRKEVKNEQAS